MRKIRLYTPQHMQAHTTLELDAGASKHACQVLRLKPGDKIYLFNGDGFEYQANIRKNSKPTTVEVHQKIQCNTESPLDITLIQGISRSDKMDFTLQKSVELGVTRIQPVFCKRSILNLDQKRLAKKVRHWRAVIHSACEQSGRCIIPELFEPTHLNELLKYKSLHSTDLILDPGSNLSIPQIVHHHSKYRLMIGPEGGFDREEITQAETFGFKAVSMGPRVMRTETAGLAAMAILQSIHGDFSQ